jgi:hypothetical protein
MSFTTLASVKEWCRVFHSSDDALLQALIDETEDEALRFLNRTEPPTLPLDYPPEYDSSSSEIPEPVPSSDDPVAKSFTKAVKVLVQAYYESPDADERRKAREAFEVILMPYRTGLGV